MPISDKDLEVCLLRIVLSYLPMGSGQQMAPQSLYSHYNHVRLVRLKDDKLLLMQDSNPGLPDPRQKLYPQHCPDPLGSGPLNTGRWAKKQVTTITSMPCV